LYTFATPVDSDRVDKRGKGGGEGWRGWQGVGKEKERRGKEENKGSEEKGGA
jgi:hypothetical protein